MKMNILDNLCHMAVRQKLWPVVHVTCESWANIEGARNR